MGKYSIEFKTQLIREYKKWEIGFKALAKKYNMTRDTVRGIIRSYLPKQNSKRLAEIPTVLDIAVCRSGGASATFDELNKYFTINNMPVVSSQYWNSVHGREKGEAKKDEEGLQTMRTLCPQYGISYKVYSLWKGEIRSA